MVQKSTHAHSIHVRRSCAKTSKMTYTVLDRHLGCALTVICMQTHGIIMLLGIQVPEESLLACKGYLADAADKNGVHADEKLQCLLQTNQTTEDMTAHNISEDN